MSTKADKHAVPAHSEIGDNVKRLGKLAKKGIHCFNKEQKYGFYKGPNGLDTMFMRLDFIQSTRNKIIEFYTQHKFKPPSLERFYSQLVEKEIDLEKMIEAEEEALFMDENFFEDTVDPESLF